MMMSQVAKALNTELHGEDVMMTGVSKDTRDIQAGDLYVALIGERFDGHRFIEQASEAGAVGALVKEYNTELDLPGLSQVQVGDTRLALGELASFWRQSWAGHQDAHQAAHQVELSGHRRKLIGITGSNGKTSVKEMCAKILVDHAGSNAVLSTKGNLNNDIGMPMMLLELRDQHQYAVIEMGANHVGEIDYLTMIAKPDVAIVNNVGPAHLEGFGSLENIAKAKAEIYNGLSENGFAVINKDDVFSSFWFDYCEQSLVKNIISFSMLDAQADIYAELVADNRYRIVSSIGRDVSGQAELKLNVPGKHNVMNALAAIAATTCIGVSLPSAVKSLSDFENIQGRLTIVESAIGCRVIDDTYNANPLSVAVAIDVLASLQTESGATTVLVLGDMAELGDDAQRLHTEIGEQAKVAGINALYATGKYCQSTVSAFAENKNDIESENGFWFQDKESLIEALNNNLTGNEVVLVKGSRSAVMEEVVAQILTHEKNNKRVN